MTEHTKEPWRADGSLVYMGCNEGGFDLRDCPSPETNAHRIVACVNALTGFTISEIESGIDLVKFKQQRDEERKKHEACVTINERLLSDNRIIAEQRDDLLAALKEARRAIGDHFSPNDCYATGPATGDSFRDLVQCPACSAIAMYDAAIAKAKL